MARTRTLSEEVKKPVSVTQAWSGEIDPSRCNKRTLLILHAIRVFHKKGVNGTGIAEVMELAGVGKGQFYHYFGSKDQFICEVVRYTMDYFLKRIAPYTSRLESLAEFDQWFQPYVEFAQLPDFMGCPVGAIASELSPSNPAVVAGSVQKNRRCAPRPRFVCSVGSSPWPRVCPCFSRKLAQWAGFSRWRRRRSWLRIFRALY